MVYHDKSETQLINIVLTELGTPKTWEAMKEKFGDEGQLNNHNLRTTLEKMRDLGLVYFVDNTIMVFDKEIQDKWYIRARTNKYKPPAWHLRNPFKYALVCALGAIGASLITHVLENMADKRLAKQESQQTEQRISDANHRLDSLIYFLSGQKNYTKILTTTDGRKYYMDTFYIGYDTVYLP